MIGEHDMDKDNICEKCPKLDECDEDCHAIWLLEDLVDGIVEDHFQNLNRLRLALQKGKW